VVSTNIKKPKQTQFATKQNLYFIKMTDQQLNDFEENFTAGNDVLNAFTNISLPVRWVVLSAQMQSGKTFVYTFIAAEMLRTNKVKKIIIFCGNPEITLREQTKDCFHGNFKRLYRQYLKSINEDESIIDSLNDRGILEVIFGTHLTSKKKTTPTQPQPISKTLFIWDESHYAQNQGMCVDKYLEGVGILPNGDFHLLEQKDNYVLSVSATAFSEISDVAYCFQRKQVITFIPSDAYIGVNEMMEKNMIVPFEDVVVCIREQLTSTVERFGDAKKFGIIRIPPDSIKNTKAQIIRVEMEQFVIAHGWDIKYYFQSDNGKKLDSLDILENAPVSGKNTIILVKSLCRMGQVLKKDHISFVIETATDSSTDVILQGLLGRMCGYDSNDQIRICLRSQIFHSGELQKYVTMTTECRTEMPDVMPSKARNLIVGSKHIFEEPFRINYKSKIILWYEASSIPGFGIEGVWMTETGTRIPKLFEFDFPNTNKREVFCRITEVGQTNQRTGRFAVGLPSGISTIVKQMRDVIMEAIKITTRPRVEEGVNFKRKLISNRKNEFQGIFIANEVLTSMKKDGQLYQLIKNRTGLALQTKYVSMLDENDLITIRLYEISW